MLLLPVLVIHSHFLLLQRAKTTPPVKRYVILGYSVDTVGRFVGDLRLVILTLVVTLGNI